VAERITTFKDRDAWIRALYASDLTLAAKAIGARLALHLHIKTGRCDPAHLTLANETGISERSVYRAIAALENAGWIEVDHSGGGRHCKNDCRLVLPETLTPASGFKDEKTLTPVSSFPTRNPDNGDKETLTPVSPLKRNKKSEEERSKTHAPSFALSESEGTSESNSGNSLDHGFEEFWRNYPRRVDKPAALKAYRRILDSGQATPADLLAGVMRYAAERDGQNARYTRHAKNWLDGECWRDEPTPPGRRSLAARLRECEAAIQREAEAADDDEGAP
jgi:hypothetical protein